MIARGRLRKQAASGLNSELFESVAERPVRVSSVGFAIRDLRPECSNPASAACDFDPTWRVADPPHLMHPAVVEKPFDNLVAEQCQHAAADEERSRIAIPVNARSPARVVHS